MTARPRGAFCIAPLAQPSDIGSMPRIIARAVIITGRRRVIAASHAARRGVALPFSDRANVTMRMLLRRHADAHDRPHQRGHDKGVPVEKSSRRSPRVHLGTRTE